MLRVTYVWHSCFVVELDHHILVFDYFPKEAVETVHFEGKCRNWMQINTFMFLQVIAIKIIFHWRYCTGKKSIQR